MPPRQLYAVGISGYGTGRPMSGYLDYSGSHMAMYDDQQVYFAGLIDFLSDLGDH